MLISEIRVKDILPLTLDSREAAIKLVSLVKEESAEHRVVLDFADIIFMSRSFADQFHKELYMDSTAFDIVIKNADFGIAEMLNVVSKTQKSRKAIKKDYQVLSFTNLDKLEDYAFSW